MSVAASPAPAKSDNCPTVSAWIQWTVAKVSASLYAEREQLDKNDTSIHESSAKLRSTCDPNYNNTCTPGVAAGIADDGIDNNIASAVETLTASLNITNDISVPTSTGPTFGTGATSAATSDQEVPKKPSSVKVPTRLRAELEDLTMAVDLQQVYTKMKCRITSFNVFHSQYEYVYIYPTAH